MVVDAPNSNGPFQPVALMHFRGTYGRIILPVRPSDRKRAELCVHLLPFPFTDYRVVFVSIRLAICVCGLGNSYVTFEIERYCYVSLRDADAT